MPPLLALECNPNLTLAEVVVEVGDGGSIAVRLDLSRFVLLIFARVSGVRLIYVLHRRGTLSGSERC